MPNKVGCQVLEYENLNLKTEHRKPIGWLAAGLMVGFVAGCLAGWITGRWLAVWLADGLAGSSSNVFNHSLSQSPYHATRVFIRYTEYIKYWHPRFVWISTLWRGERSIISILPSPIQTLLASLRLAPLHKYTTYTKYI